MLLIVWNSPGTFSSSGREQEKRIFDSLKFGHLNIEAAGVR
jgi:hypothetical protein